MNPETDDILWFHGSSNEEPLDLQPSFDDSEHMAFFLSSSKGYAAEYASTDWTGEPAEFEALYELKVRYCNLLAVDDLVGVDRTLNSEGMRLAAQIQKSNPDWSLARITNGLLEVADSMDWQHFIDVGYYDNTLGEALPLYSLPVAIKELGYDGWIERRTTGAVRSHTDLAIFKPSIANVEIARVVYVIDNTDSIDDLRDNPIAHIRDGAWPDEMRVRSYRSLNGMFVKDHTFPKGKYEAEITRYSTDPIKIVGESYVSMYRDDIRLWRHAPLNPSQISQLETIIGGKYPVGVVLDIKIRDEFRGQGYGRSILRDSISHLAEQGAKTILLVLDNIDNNPFKLVEWYIREGFELTGVKTRYNYSIMVLRNLDK